MHVRSSLLALALVVATGVSLVWAAGPGAPLRAIPFSGHLEHDGEPVNDAAVSMEFTLFDDAVSETPFWTEEQTVPVYAGTFAVLLGEATALPDEVFDRAELFVTVSVAGVALLGRQRIVPSLQSVAAAQARNLDVALDLSVGGNVSVGGGVVAAGEVAAASASTTGDVDIGGELSVAGGHLPDAELLITNLTLNQARTLSHGLGVLPSRVAVWLTADTTGQSGPWHLSQGAWKNLDGEFVRGMLVTNVTTTSGVLRTGREDNCGLMDTFGMGENITHPRVCLVSGAARVLFWK